MAHCGDGEAGRDARIELFRRKKIRHLRFTVLRTTPEAREYLLARERLPGAPDALLSLYPVPERILAGLGETHLNPAELSVFLRKLKRRLGLRPKRRRREQRT